MLFRANLWDSQLVTPVAGPVRIRLTTFIFGTTFSHLFFSRKTLSTQYCADPALPPIEQDGEFISIVMEPARKFQVPDISSKTDRDYRSGTRTDANVGQESCLPYIHSCRGSSW